MSKVIEVTDSTFKSEVLEHNGIVVVDFWADYCGPCKMFASVLEDLARCYKEAVKFVKLDIEKNEYTATRNNIKSLPTILIFNNGNLVDSIAGTTTRKTLMARIEDEKLRCKK